MIITLKQQCNWMFQTVFLYKLTTGYDV